MQGHIHKRTHTCRDGRQTSRWYVVIEVDRGLDGRRRQQWHGGFFTRREAEVARARLVNDVHNRRYVVRSRLTLAEWVQQSWLPIMETRVKPTTVHGYRQMMEDYVLPALGNRPLQKLTTLEVDCLYADLIRGERSGRPLSLNTVTNVHRALHKSLADAVDAGLVVGNVASRAKAPRPARIQTPRVSAWMPNELAAFLIAVARDRLAAVWRLAAMTGMRRGEVLGLRWQDIDFERRRLSVRRAFVEVNYRVVESTPKGREARTIDLDWRTASALASHRESQLDESREWGADYAHNDLVTAWQDGSPIHPQTFTRMFQNLIAEAGLRRIRLHDLRRTHATLALLAGVPVTTVSERLGHHSPAFTLRQYAHALPGMQAPAAAVLGEVINNYETPADEGRRAREIRQPSPGLRAIDHGSEYQRLISLFVSCVEQAGCAGHVGEAATVRFDLPTPDDSAVPRLLGPGAAGTSAFPLA
jgi:integrase